ncbi:hypothetical protein K449DRAFT_21044 [Hypoxylon sp. EC38]|nr:hypothetical protein K449DRAFT_21044 [Hypoxylon sp. EC38]
MSRLEALPVELQRMIINECSPRDLLALISASPTYLRDFNKGRTRILAKYIYPTITERSHHPIDVALGLAKVHAKRKHLVEHDPRTRGQLLVDYLRDALESDPDSRIRSPLQEGLSFFVHVQELREEARRLAPRLEPGVLSTIWSLESSRFRPTHPVLWPREDLRVERGVLMFEMYCLSLDISDGYIAPEISRFWRPHFGAHLGSRSHPNHDLFYAVFTQIVREHRKIVREVAYDLHITEFPDFETSTTTTNEEAKEAQTKEQPASLAVLSSQIQLLDKRTELEEYSYCRYLTTLGIGLMNRLKAMTREERRDYTLTKFSWFREMQRGLAWRASPLRLLFIYVR